jgi:hypothetical protein
MQIRADKHKRRGPDPRLVKRLQQLYHIAPPLVEFSTVYSTPVFIDLRLLYNIYKGTQGELISQYEDASFSQPVMREPTLLDIFHRQQRPIIPAGRFHRPRHHSGKSIF